MIFHSRYFIARVRLTVQKGHMVQKRFYHYLICCFIVLVCLFTSACSHQDNNSNNATLSGSASKAKISDSIVPDEIIITEQPRSVSALENRGFSMHVKASSELALTYQWYKDDQEISGANSATYAKSSSTKDDAGLYTVLISNALSELRSLSASVNITNITPLNAKLDITKQPKGVSISEGDAILLSVEVNDAAEVSYQWQKNGSIIPGATQSSFFIAQSKPSDQGNYRVTVSNDLRQVSSNFVNVWVSETLKAVSINKQPQSKTITEGESTAFSISASGDGFLRYQWRRNGIPIENQFKTFFEIPSVSPEDQGSYDVVVTNSQGSVYSKAANLTVLSNTPPVIITEHPQPTTITVGQAISLSVNASGGETLFYQWYFNGNAIKNATTDSLYIANASMENEGYYSVLVNNEADSQQSNTSFVSVTPPALHAIELTWDTPTQREDGSPLSEEEIKGYIIEYGQQANTLDSSITVEHRTQNALILDQLSASQLFLRIATIDSDNHQGAFSNTISVSLQ